MKIYLDDVRPAPEGWVLTKTAPETIKLLYTGGVTHLSLDHDLGEESGVGNGYDVLLWIEDAVESFQFLPPVIDVHSSNSGARPKMEAAIRSIQKLAAR